MCLAEDGILMMSGHSFIIVGVECLSEIVKVSVLCVVQGEDWPVLRKSFFVLFYFLVFYFTCFVI